MASSSPDTVEDCAVLELKRALLRSFGSSESLAATTIDALFCASSGLVTSAGD